MTSDVSTPISFPFQLGEDPKSTSAPQHLISNPGSPLHQGIQSYDFFALLIKGKNFSRVAEMAISAGNNHFRRSHRRSNENTFDDDYNCLLEKV